MILFLFLFSLLQADSVLLVKKGWQLIGANEPMENMSAFKLDEVEEVWHFDAKTQTWLGYSPDETIQNKMTQKGIAPLASLKAWHGFWVKSKKEWALSFKSAILTQAPSKDEAQIVLEKGWNLISLPIDATVSADIFKGMTVWNYNAKSNWELSQSDSVEDFPVLTQIKKSDGIWVKSETQQHISVAKEIAKLRNFESNEAMESYLTQMLTANSSGQYLPTVPLGANDDVALPTTAEVSTADASTTTVTLGNASGTNVQEEGVDEADILKHNGKNIFYKISNQQIGITTFERLVTGEKGALSGLEFAPNESIDSFYLVNNHLVVLLNALYSSKDIEMDTTSSTSPAYSSEKNRLIMYDVSDIDNIQKDADFKIDGNKVDSRVVGDNLYLISTFTPKVEITYPKEYVALPSVCEGYFNTSVASSLVPYEERNDFTICYDIYKDSETNRYYRYNYDEPKVSIEQLLPKIEGSSTATLLTPENFYAPLKQSQTSSITTISRFSIGEGAYKNATSFVGNTSVRYASLNAFYLVSEEYPLYYDYSNFKMRSMLYKFSLNNTLAYKGRGVVNGTVLNQFSLSEYDNILRIATTEGFSWGDNETKNTLYTLKEQENSLVTVGVLSGLGKEQETIKSVRFMGNRAYVVTFKQTDPLYTLDLSDASSPKKVGALEVSGFSSYLHPINENLLLGFGREANSEGQTEGLKLELYDVSDFANPTAIDSVTFTNNSYSELEYNHKALAYRKSDQLLAFPYRIWSNYGNSSSDYLGVYQVENNALVAYESIVNNNERGWGQNRGLIFDNNETTYVSFFANGPIITEPINKK